MTEYTSADLIDCKPETKFDAWAGQQLADVEAALEAWVPATAPAGLGLAMRYGVLDGG